MTQSSPKKEFISVRDIIDPNMLQLLEDVLKTAKSYGATSGDAVLVDSASVSVTRRLGKQEALQRSEESEIGLRVFVGRRQAVVSSSDRSPQALKDAAERAVAMAKLVPEDEFAGIAAPEELATAFPDLDLYDARDVTVSELNDMADSMEAAGRAVAGVTNSEGAEAATGKDAVYFVATNGFAQGYMTSGTSLSVSLIAGKGTAMETDYDYDSAVYLSDLRSPEDIGRSAAEKAVRSLNPRKAPTGQVPVIYDRQVSGGIIGMLSGAISGAAIARGTSILKDKMNDAVMNPGITIVDDPFLPRGSRSNPFDAEGIAPERRVIVENGVLKGWLLDLASARQLGLKTTGNAVRSAGAAPGPKAANFYMLPGAKTVAELVADIEEGLFITQFLGGGGNVLTGDYSRGARGFWIEKGEIAYPVSEITVAGNLKDMWQRLTPANDLMMTYGIDAPSLRIDGLTVAGI